MKGAKNRAIKSAEKRRKIARIISYICGDAAPEGLTARPLTADDNDPRLYFSATIRRNDKLTDIVGGGFCGFEADMGKLVEGASHGLLKPAKPLPGKYRVIVEVSEGLSDDSPRKSWVLLPKEYLCVVDSVDRRFFGGEE